jgi:hypothetical protein
MPVKDIKKEVRYLNKDFATFRNDLIEFSKVYFPDTYSDFNESSPGMMFIEMASYVGDVLSYYIDNQFKESLLAYAEERKTIYEIVQSLGYKPKLSAPSVTKADVFQIVPATGTGDAVQPDMTYALTIDDGMRIESQTNNVIFRTLDDVNFKFSGSFDPMTVDIYETSTVTNLPTYYLLKKKATLVSGKIATEYFDMASAQKYSKITLANSNVMDIINVTDSDSNKWYEVDSLARDTIYEDMENNSTNDPTSVINADTAPYILKLKKTSRRFTTYIDEKDKTILRFGAGISDNADEEIVPNPDSVGSTLPGSPSHLTKAFDPSNFLKTKAFGLAPSNTTLTVKYAHGGGISDNANANNITEVSSVSFDIADNLLSATLVQNAKDSLAVTNPNPATGGSAGQSIREVRERALAYYQAQQRAVTKEDYIVRVYSLPPKYGNIAKAFMVQDDQLNETVGIEKQNSLITAQDVGKSVKSISARIPNPLAMNLYTLGYNVNKNLAPLNQTVKQNLKTYLSQYRLATDAINIKDAYIINISVNFAILTKLGFNKNDVLLRCISTVKEFFDIDRWQIGQPIILTDIAYELSLIDGVASVVAPTENNPDKLPIVVENKYKIQDGYSGNFYDIQSGMIESILYPALDPSIFEVKFPNSDIKGRVLGDNLGIME